MKVFACTLLVVVLMAVAKESSAQLEELKGCYVKNYGDDVFPYSLVDRKMSNAMCIQHCRNGGYAFAGTKSVRCGCGTEEHLAIMTKADEADCTNSCKAGGGICGGFARLTVYSTAQPGKRELREILGDLTNTLEKLNNAYKREMGEPEDVEEEMREMEEMAENEE